MELYETIEEIMKKLISQIINNNNNNNKLTLFLGLICSSRDAVGLEWARSGPLRLVVKDLAI